MINYAGIISLLSNIINISIDSYRDKYAIAVYHVYSYFDHKQDDVFVFLR